MTFTFTGFSIQTTKKVDSDEQRDKRERDPIYKGHCKKKTLVNYELSLSLSTVVNYEPPILSGDRNGLDDDGQSCAKRKKSTNWLSTINPSGIKLQEGWKRWVVNAFNPLTRIAGAFWGGGARGHGRRQPGAEYYLLFGCRESSWSTMNPKEKFLFGFYLIMMT